jgi:hypothetical protein
MWLSFAAMGLIVLILFMIYNKFVINGGKKDLPRHEAHIIHAEDGEDVPEIPELE